MLKHHAREGLEGIETGHPHIFGYDITGDGLTDYLIEIFSLTYRDSSRWNYTTTSVLLFGSDQGLTDSEYEFGGIEFSGSGEFYHERLYHSIYFLKAGVYSFDKKSIEYYIHV